MKQFNFDELDEYFTQKCIKEQSKKQHISQMKRVLKKILGTEYSKTNVKQSLSKFLKYIVTDELPNYNSKKNHMTSMFHLYTALKAPTQRMEKVFDEMKQKAFAERANGMTDKAKTKFDKVDFDKIKSMYQELEIGSDNRLILVLYSGMMPTLRGQEWLELKTINSKKKPAGMKNYLNLKTGMLHIEDAKSKGGYLEKDVIVPDDVLDEIKQYLKIKNTDVILQGMSSSVLSKRLTKLIGTSVQALRKKYVSMVSKKGLTADERIELARIMGHNLLTQAIDYDKS